MTAPIERPLRSGKLSAELLTELLAELPAAPPELRLKPRVGEDACAIEIPGGVLIAATDPITLSSTEIGRLAVIVNANDLAVTGARPRWFLAVILVPPGTGEAVVRDLFTAVGTTLTEVGAFLVGGHIEVTPVVTRPIVVGQMLGLAEGDRFVATGGVVPGN
ncbi:MAG: AIR synthase related protein, partial [Gaiellaceae bacterium]